MLNVPLMDSFAVIKALFVIILVASSQWFLTCAEPIKAEELACIGESKALSCQSSGINYTRLSIRRANQPINEKPGKYRWSQDGALVVENIQKADDGFYFYYKIENQIQIYKCVVKLRVNCQCVHVTSGSTASMPCHVDAKPDLQNAVVTWKKETTTGYLTLVNKGKLTNLSSYNQRLKLLRGGVVMVYKVNTNDSGVYMCQVIRRQVRKRFFVTLNVTDGTLLTTMPAVTSAGSSSSMWPSLSTMGSGSFTNQSDTNAVNSTMESSGTSVNRSHLLLTQTLNVVLLIICYTFN